MQNLKRDARSNPTKLRWSKKMQMFKTLQVHTRSSCTSNHPTTVVESRPRLARQPRPSRSICMMCGNVLSASLSHFTRHQHGSGRKCHSAPAKANSLLLTYFKRLKTTKKCGSFVKSSKFACSQDVFKHILTLLSKSKSCFVVPPCADGGGLNHNKKKTRE